MSTAGLNLTSFAIISADLLLITIHFLVFICFLRRKASGQEEKRILLYHVMLFVVGLIGSGLASVLIYGTINFQVLVIVASLQGLYSMTFLEAWSLSEGSYSYLILSHIDSAQKLDPNALMHIGDEKRATRSQGLVGLGFLNQQDGYLAIIARGWTVAKALAVVLWLVNVKRAG